ncbi:MAG: aminotransferase class I/II-fold pyridoxal phosphate-dependent enzyme [Candidatus Latescibacteria bacterium]|jgi:histidinol-phosphate aminotransferase|nr:aminotransferase class I/II-fold pyridoxal phosphate-dependent enzyme [Candidatus Latescibacterota bacterium]
MGPTNSTDSTFSRRGFMKGALIGSVGALTADPSSIAYAMLAGTTPADIQGIGIRKGLVNLSSNENPLGPSAKAVEAVAQNMFHVNRYGWSMTPVPEDLLRNAIEKHHNLPETTVTMENWQEAWKERRVMISAGSGPILEFAAITAIKDGAELVQARPAYSDIAEVWMKFKRRQNANVKLHLVPLDDAYLHDLNAMYKRINQNTTMVVITNPNNPSGTLLGHDELADFVQSVPKHVTVFIDEAYIHFVREPGYRDAVHLATEHDNVIVARTFSKIHGLAGMRVGYSVAHPDTHRRMDLYPVPEPSVLGCFAAAAALEDHDHIARCRQVAKAGKDYLGKSFDRLGIEYVPSDGSFMLFNMKREVATTFAALAEKNVEIADANWWGVKEHLRVTVGTPAENEAFIGALEQVLQESRPVAQ